MVNLIRAAAEVLANLSEQARRLADWSSEPPGDFAGVDIVGIDFSTSIVRVARHIIHGWDLYREQVRALKREHGVWLFGVNSVPFSLTPHPVAPERLPGFLEANFQRRGNGPGLIEYGSAFYDYFLVALGQAHRLAAAGGGRPLAITISLLCDGVPNGGVYRASDVRPLIEEARTAGVRFKLVGAVLTRYRHAMSQFRDSLGFTREELEIAWYDEGAPDGGSICGSFDSLSRF